MSQQAYSESVEDQDEEQAENQAPDQDEENTSEDGYVRQTMYLRESRKKALSDWFKLLELNFIEEVDSSVCETIEHRRVMHEALVEHAMNNPQEYVNTLEELQ